MGAIDTVKELAVLIQKLDNIELLKQVVSLQEQVYALVDENRSLKERLATRGKLSFRKNAYWLDDQGPFCSNCWDGTQKLVRMHLSKEFNPQCPRCTRMAVDPEEGDELV